MASKKQQTFAKLQRERKVKERQQLKREKKLAAAARKHAAANGEPEPTGFDGEPNADPAVPPQEDSPAGTLPEV